MKDSLRAGVSKARRVVIDGARTISFMGEEGRVYATPAMIGDMEYLCRDLLLEHADKGEDSVGVEVAVRHTAATLPGMTAEITAVVKAIEGRKVIFEVSAKDDMEPIGGGTHARFVVDVVKTFERLKAKAAKRSSGK
jgi:fluoroacetyl-CoA thioesterase